MNIDNYSSPFQKKSFWKKYWWLSLVIVVALLLAGATWWWVNKTFFELQWHKGYPADRALVLDAMTNLDTTPASSSLSSRTGSAEAYQQVAPLWTAVGDYPDYDNLSEASAKRASNVVTVWQALDSQPSSTEDVWRVRINTPATALASSGRADIDPVARVDYAYFPMNDGQTACRQIEWVEETPDKKYIYPENVLFSLPDAFQQTEFFLQPLDADQGYCLLVKYEHRYQINNRLSYLEIYNSFLIQPSSPEQGTTDYATPRRATLLGTQNYNLTTSVDVNQASTELHESATGHVESQLQIVETQTEAAGLRFEVWRPHPYYDDIAYDLGSVSWTKVPEVQDCTFASFFNLDNQSQAGITDDWGEYIPIESADLGSRYCFKVVLEAEVDHIIDYHPEFLFVMSRDLGVVGAGTLVDITDSDD